jgi:hypothetical protein
VPVFVDQVGLDGGSDLVGRGRRRPDDQGLDLPVRTPTSGLDEVVPASRPTSAASQRGRLTSYYRTGADGGVAANGRRPTAPFHCG